MRKNGFNRKCLRCKKEFYIPLSYASGKGGKKGIYCSSLCSAYMNGFRKGNTVGVGEKNGRWQGGKTRLSARLRSLKIYDDWRRAIFMRDDYTCVLCKKPSNGDIEADHMTPSAQILDFYKIIDVDDAIACKPLWDIDNGRTLCKDCHRKTDTYASNYFRYKKTL